MKQKFVEHKAKNNDIYEIFGSNILPAYCRELLM